MNRQVSNREWPVSSSDTISCYRRCPSVGHCGHDCEHVLVPPTPSPLVPSVGNDLVLRPDPMCRFPLSDPLKLMPQCPSRGPYA